MPGLKGIPTPWKDVPSLGTLTPAIYPGLLHATHTWTVASQCSIPCQVEISEEEEEM